MEKAPHVKAFLMLLAPVPFSRKVYPALKSTPDDFFFFLHHSPLTTPLSPLLEVSIPRDSRLPPPLSMSSHFLMQACVQTHCSSLKICELLPHANRPSSFSLARELHQLPLVVFSGGGGVCEREGGSCLRMLLSGPSPFHLAWLRSLHPHRGVIR